MVLFNYSTRELTAKIVYYGPGLCGKTTNLQYIHGTLPENVKGKMLSLATKTDRTLFFDFLPIDLGEIRGMKTRVQLYTVPGQVFYNETRKLVLKGADGIVFVADSQAAMLGANVESFRNLEENLKAHGMKLSEMPHVIQFNKRDLPKLSDIEELNSAVNRYNAPFYESVATTGIGVQDSLKAITKLVLLHLTRKYDPKSAPAQAPGVRAPAAAPMPSAPVAPAAPVDPARTMQMPTAAVGGNPAAVGAIPVTGASAGAPPPAGHTAMRDMPASQGGAGPPDFAEQDIDRLVDEVEETEPEVAAAPSVVEAPLPPLTEEPSSVPAASAEADEAAVGAEPAFEIDHQIDPEWTEEPPAPLADATPAEPAEEQTWQLGPGEDEDGAALVPDPAVRTPLDEQTAPTLADVVQGPELFDDPSLEVARMAAGEVREILIPVEVGDESTGVRRFKLCVRLRLDPVD